MSVHGTTFNRWNGSSNEHHYLAKDKTLTTLTNAFIGNGGIVEDLDDIKAATEGTEVNTGLILTDTNALVVDVASLDTKADTTNSLLTSIASTSAEKFNIQDYMLLDEYNFSNDTAADYVNNNNYLWVSADTSSITYSTTSGDTNNSGGYYITGQAAVGFYRDTSRYIMPPYTDCYTECTFTGINDAVNNTFVLSCGFNRLYLPNPTGTRVKGALWRYNPTNADFQKLSILVDLTGGSNGDFTSIQQQNFNIDPLDGTGPSGISAGSLQGRTVTLVVAKRANSFTFYVEENGVLWQVHSEIPYNQNLNSKKTFRPLLRSAIFLSSTSIWSSTEPLKILSIRNYCKSPNPAPRPLTQYGGLIVPIGDPDPAEVAFLTVKQQMPANTPQTIPAAPKLRDFHYTITPNTDHLLRIYWVPNAVDDTAYSGTPQFKGMLEFYEEGNGGTHAAVGIITNKEEIFMHFGSGSTIRHEIPLSTLNTELTLLSYGGGAATDSTYAVAGLVFTIEILTINETLEVSSYLLNWNQ